MSLDPNASARRGRSKSPGRERSRSRGLVNNDDYEPPSRERDRSKVRAAPDPPPASRYERDDSPPSSKYAARGYDRETSPPSKYGGGKGYDRETSPPSSKYGAGRGYDRDTSPPSSKDKYGGGRGGGYSYEERETTTTRTSKGGREKDSRDVAVVTAEPRDRGDPKSSYGSLSKFRDRDESASPPQSAKGRGYSMPGAFEEEVKTKDVRYESGRGGGRDGRGGREKEYYEERRKDTYSPEKPKYRNASPPEKPKYGRAASPPSKIRYQDLEEFKYSKPSKPKDDDRDLAYGGYESDDKKDKHARDRGASFNVSTAHSSISGGINVSHDKPQYGQPPSPGGHRQQPPYVAPGGYVPYPEVPGGRPYAEPAKYEYAQPQEALTYSKHQETAYAGPASPPQAYNAYDSSRRESRHGSSSHLGDPRSSKEKIVTVDPGSRRRDKSPNPGAGLAPRMHSLSVSTGHHSASMSLANAPGSPLLEAYHGTYQSISPMPSPLMIASAAHSDVNFIEALSPESSDDDRRDKKSRRTARFHDPVDEAKILAQALKGEKRAPDTDPLIEILPGLTHEQILELRVEYKRIVKTGHEKKGVNIAKHIKLRLKEEDPSLMKACYACALGKWESEAYWANFWYQGEKSRRELLIESLFGRTNREIREIKDGFSDKKYSDSLTKCMKTELKEDKFKKAVLLVLDERKMEEGRGGVDRQLVDEDVRDLHKAVRAEKGGESAMISIIVVRSDAHLREVLRAYEATYRGNFAREMLKKSGNLVVCSPFLFLIQPRST